MKKKIFLIFISVLFITGCSNNYNLTINGDTISEEIVSTIPSTDLVTQTEEEKAAGVEADDQITPFIKEDQYPFIDNEKIKYEKNVSKNGNNIIVKLKYDYTVDNFKNSRVYNECFEKSVIKRENGYLKLAFMGEFYCLYGDSLNINVKTDREVINDTANEVDNDTYTWVVNENNVNNVNIQMILDDQITSSDGSGLIIFFVVFFVGIIIVYMFVLKKPRNH